MRKVYVLEFERPNVVGTLVRSYVVEGGFDSEKGEPIHFKSEEDAERWLNSKECSDYLYDDADYIVRKIYVTKKNIKYHR
jgi:hypothetical protein